MSLYLSKSKYCSGIQCPKMLWLKKYKPEMSDDSASNTNVLATGIEVGNFAKGLFGDYIEVPYDNPSDMINQTKTLVRKGTPIIAEASFSHEGLFCSVDILKNLGNNQVEIYEVKSSTEIKDIYYSDVAFQYYVLTMLGFQVKRICIVHINNEYMRIGQLEKDKFFKIVDVTAIAKEMNASVISNLTYFTEYLEQSNEPNDDIGLHCFNPYECGFFNYCTRNLPQPNVFSLRGQEISKKQKFDLYYDGLISFEHLHNNDKIKRKQELQIKAELTRKEEINKKTIQEFLDTLSYPLYFLDFETFMPAIPFFDYTKPYQQIVFQYSLHYIESDGSMLKHKEYLAYPGSDPRRMLAEQLCKDIPLNVCTTAYNMAFERIRIKELAEIYPDLSEHLMNIHDNIHDLMVPFKNKDYYTKAMQGSYSIKYVLPALFPDDPSLDYHNLEGVHNGNEASATFERMGKLSTEELAECREHLLRYCGLDTYAMVKVWKKLQQAVK